MSNNGPKNKNPKKNIYIPPSRLNINNPFIDPSGVNLKNPLFNPLQNSNKKNLLLLKNTSENNCQNNLETIEKIFNMTTTKIIKQIKNSRDSNGRKTSKQCNVSFSKLLDDKKSSINNDKDVPLSVFMSNVNNNFNTIHNSSNSFFNTNFSKSSPGKFSNIFDNKHDKWKFYAGQRPRLPPPPPPSPTPKRSPPPARARRSRRPVSPAPGNGPRGRGAGRARTCSSVKPAVASAVAVAAGLEPL